MNQRPPRPEKVASPEKNPYQLKEVDASLTGALMNLRQVVDGTKIDDKLRTELERYVSSSHQKAFIMMDVEDPVAYVEIDLNSAFKPKGANEDLFKRISTFAHIARIGVKDHASRQGLGKRLLQVAEDWVKSQRTSAEGIWLDYLPHREGLEPFYESAGYQAYDEFIDEHKGKLRRIAVKYF